MVFHEVKTVLIKILYCLYFYVFLKFKLVLFMKFTLLLLSVILSGCASDIGPSANRELKKSTAQKQIESIEPPILTGQTLRNPDDRSFGKSLRSSNPTNKRGF